MKMIFFFLFLIAVEVLFTIVFKKYFLKNVKIKFLKLFLFCTIPLWLAFLLGVFVLYIYNFDLQYYRYSWIFYILTTYFLFLIPKIFFTALCVPFILISFAARNFSIHKWIKFFSFTLSLLVFIIMLYGIIIGKNKIAISKIELKVENLPKEFDGFKIVQLSDIHIGSFWGNPAFMQKVADSCNAQKPDIIAFTGDIVNQYSDELTGMSKPLSDLQATFGKYAVLGNHDFGDYTLWKHPSEKDKNLNDLIQHIESSGFKYLRNRHEYIHKGNDSIAIIGVDNWGVKPFKQYGDLKKAEEGLYKDNFSIILSHDPTHWDEQIKESNQNSLTLSGHTHAFQVGFDFGNIKWSPVVWRYKKWWGLYSEKNNYLYVSRGIGTIGFMGRIGMYPEIVVITLRCK